VVFVALLIEAGVIVVLQGRAGMSSLTPPTGSFANPADIGMALFTHYSLPFELTSVLLVLAAVGAIVLTHRSKREQSLSPQSSPTTLTGTGGGSQKPPTEASSTSSGVQRGQGGEGI